MVLSSYTVRSVVAVLEGPNHISGRRWQRYSQLLSYSKASCRSWLSITLRSSPLRCIYATLNCMLLRTSPAWTLPCQPNKFRWTSQYSQRKSITADALKRTGLVSWCSGAGRTKGLHSLVCACSDQTVWKRRNIHQLILIRLAARTLQSRVFA